jgi:hypothetical protein
MKRIEQRIRTDGNRVWDPALISLIEASNCFFAVARAHSGARQILFPNRGAGRGSLLGVCFGPFEVGIALISPENVRYALRVCFCSKFSVSARIEFNLCFQPHLREPVA